jgi:hypothetical protein
MSIQRRLRFVALGWMPLVLVACSGNTLVGEEPADVPPLVVALNHRLFASPSMTPLGSGCVTYQLRPGGPSSSSGAGSVASGLPFVVSETAVDYTVVVEVTENDQEVVEKVYDEPFFDSGKRDDFTVTSSEQTMLLRYWATFDANGRPVCAPSTDDGSQTPLR